MRDQSAMKSWIPLVCALCAGCDDELELEDVEATEQNVTSVVTPVGVGQHMGTSAGTKVVVGPGNKLHAVYADAGRIKYMTSADGVGWTSPAIIGDAQASSPTIAVAVDGTLGVAYRKGTGPNSYIHYMFKHPSDAWSPSVRVTSNGTSQGARAGRFDRSCRVDVVNRGDVDPSRARHSLIGMRRVP